MSVCVKAVDDPSAGSRLSTNLISHKVFSRSFCKSQFSNISANLFFILVTVKDKLTDLCGS